MNATKCTIISGTNYPEVELKVNRFLLVNRGIQIIQIVNMSDAQYVAIAIFYREL